MAALFQMTQGEVEQAYGKRTVSSANSNQDARRCAPEDYPVGSNETDHS